MARAATTKHQSSAVLPGRRYRAERDARLTMSTVEAAEGGSADGRDGNTRAGRLEAESGPEGHVQIVVGAVIEIHHVTGFRSQSEHVADKELHTRAGVKHSVRVAIENATKGVGKACSRSAMGHTEVEEPAF